ncbi:MAG: double zinc ribbon domain-containing protein [Oscillospiraceae bacterium]|jgi:ComF family protein|nr:double zinc ribbon domain-containing protein [Oscillospiraceae bacterium]
MRLDQIKERILDLLYPPDCNCLACGNPLYWEEHTLCAACAAELEPVEGLRCRVCSRLLKSDRELAEGLCVGCGRRPLERRIHGGAPLEHKGAAARLVYALKYDHVKAAAEPLVSRMLDWLPDGFDALTPVPLHHRRERSRGYNQARVLCEGLSRLSGLPVLDALRRTRVTRAQMSLSADRREGNVKDAFEAIEPCYGKRLILVDDVRTTGMTALACAEELYLAGAIDVRTLTATLAMMDTVERPPSPFASVSP